MTGYIQLLETLKNELASYGMINSITSGLGDEIDLSKQTIFPMAHIIVETGTPVNNIINWNLKIYILDVEDYNSTDITNLDYIHNTTFDIGLRLYESYRRGDVWDTGFDIVSLQMTRIEKAYENNLAGWQVSAQIQTPNHMSIC